MLKTPQPWDKKIEFDTYRTVIETVQKVMADGGSQYTYDNYMFRIAKIKDIGTIGDYSAEEMTWDNISKTWKQIVGGLIWDSSSTNICRYPDLVVLNALDAFELDQIVIVFCNPRGHNAWTIAGTGGTATDNWFKVSSYIDTNDQLFIRVHDGLFLSPTGRHLPTFADTKIGTPGEYDSVQIKQYFEGPLVFALSNINTIETMIETLHIKSNSFYATNKGIVTNYGLQVQTINNYSTTYIYDVGNCDDGESASQDSESSLSSQSMSSLSSPSESSESSGGLSGGDYEFNVFFVITNTDLGVETYGIKFTREDLVNYIRTDAVYPGYINGKCVWNIKLAHVKCINESSSSDSTTGSA
jgi:hypothetical protein